MAVPDYILLIEDSPDDAVLIQAMLAQGSVAAAPLVRWVRTVAAAIRTLDAEPGCAALLLDAGLPEGPALAALAAIRSRAADAPVIVLLGGPGADGGLAAVLAGAQDYLVKGRLDAGLLERALHYAAERKKIEAALVERALHDPLTDLPKRPLLLDRLGVAMRRCARDGSSGALLLIDLNRPDQIDPVNRHATGDAVVRAVGACLTALVRRSDTVARMDGDRLAVLLPNESGVLEVLAIGEKLVAALAGPLAINGGVVKLSASVGVARFRDATEAAELVVERAYRAMDAARQDRKGRVHLS